MGNKYKNNALWYLWTTNEVFDPSTGFTPSKAEREFYWYFASQLEWDVFQLMLRTVPLRCIAKDEPLTLVRDSRKGGELEVIYKPDFTLFSPTTRTKYLIECKGFMTPMANLKLKLLAIHHPKLAQNTHLVFRRSQRINCNLPLHYHSVKGFEEWLTTI